MGEGKKWLVFGKMQHFISCPGLRDTGCNMLSSVSQGRVEGLAGLLVGRYCPGIPGKCSVLRPWSLGPGQPPASEPWKGLCPPVLDMRVISIWEEDE